MTDVERIKSALRIFCLNSEDSYNTKQKIFGDDDNLVRYFKAQKETFEFMIDFIDKNI